jgi:hypothetical protein
MSEDRDDNAEQDTQLGAVRRFAADLADTVGLARRLVARGVAVDLTGLEQQVGLLCAKTLDLPPEQGRRMRPDLIALDADVGQLARALAAARPPDN